MATIGHTLIGLSMAALPGPDARRDRRLWVIWPGVLVLLGHLVDLAEWVVIVAAPTVFDSHFVSNSPLVAVGLVGVVSLMLATVCGQRRLWPFVIAAIVVLSHVVMDLRGVRIWILRSSGLTDDPEAPGLGPLVAGDLWLYGLLFVWFLMLKAALQPRVSPKSRWLAGILLAFSTIAAMTRTPTLWAVAYVLATGHALLLLRRELGPSRLWGILPILPLLGLLGVELWAAHVQGLADERRESGDFVNAASLYREAIDIPTRSAKLDGWLKLSHCQVQMRDVYAAERSLRRAAALAERPWLARYWLGVLYGHEYAVGTDLYRPAEAAEIFNELINGPYDPSLKNSARARLEGLRKRGAAPSG